MNDVITLIAADGTRRDVFAGKRSIGMREFYQAQASDFYPEIKFVLADSLEYQNERLLESGGQVYQVLRTYCTGQELELTVCRAAAEEGGIYG